MMRLLAVSARQVVAGRKSATRATQNHAVNSPVVVRLPQGFIQFGLQFDRQGVEFLRTVEGDPRATVRHVVLDTVETSHLSPPAAWNARRRLPLAK